MFHAILPPDDGCRRFPLIRVFINVENIFGFITAESALSATRKKYVSVRDRKARDDDAAFASYYSCDGGELDGCQGS